MTGVIAGTAMVVVTAVFAVRPFVTVLSLLGLGR